MLARSDVDIPLAPNFSFWLPPNGHQVQTGAEALKVSLPEIPLPILNSALEKGVPSDDMIGSSLYDYLRQYPDCPHNTAYASLLRDAWPHYLADLAAQAIMLDHKVVDAPYVQRKIVGLKIFLLLSPENPGLLLQLGLSYNDLALMFSELHRCRNLLLQAMDYFLQVQKLQPQETASLNGLAQIDYFLGDYPMARHRWQGLLLHLTDPHSQQAVQTRLEQFDADKAPDHPLIDDLESVGHAMQLLANNGESEARDIMESLDASGVIIQHFPSPEFYCLLAACRERTGDFDAARVAYIQALDLEPDFEPATAGLEKLLAGGA
jgi:tetratricopeptide (TPR) repeat protein